MTSDACRRCSECIGQQHHWMENGRLVDETDPYFICKHCDAACDEADPQEGFAEPSGVLRGQPPTCNGCDFYEKDCQCEIEDHSDCEQCTGYSDRDDEYPLDRDDDYLEDIAREGCVLGAECLHHDPFHTSAECFDVEMAKAHMAPEQTEGDQS